MTSPRFARPTRRIAASVGAGISMGFAQALSDDGPLIGRGAPALRGTVRGTMTAVGGLGHTLPYLILAIRQDRANRDNPGQVEFQSPA
jgi:hypothetical protein